MIKVRGVRKHSVLVILLIGCGGVEEDPSVNPTDLSFASFPGYETVMESAVSRLSKATGDTFTIDSSGVPVIFQPQVYREGKQQCGYTDVVKEVIEVVSTEVFIATDPIGIACMELDSTLMHESIHAFTDAKHVAQGLYSANGSADGLLNGPSLDVLCEGIGCWNRQDEY